MNINLRFFKSRKVCFSLFFILVVGIFAISFYVNSSFSAPSTDEFDSELSDNTTDNLAANIQNTTPAPDVVISSTSPDNKTPESSPASLEKKTSSNDKMTIVMLPKNPLMAVNGIKMEIDPPGKGTAPIIENGRVLIPISSIVSVLGGNTSWNDESKQITVELNNNVIEFGINNPTIVVNGTSKQMDIAPKIVNERTLVPIRFLVESCNLNIQWKNRKIIIVANYVPEGIQRTKKFFDNTTEIENFSKIPSIVNTLTRIY